MKTVMVFGTFDILHPGHENFFKQAKKYGEYLIVIVARDKTVIKVKGALPINKEIIRLKNLENLQIAKKVILGSEGDKYDVVRKYRPDCICLGYDQKFFIDKLEKEFPKIEIIRLKAYKPEIYKSSKLKSSI